MHGVRLECLPDLGNSCFQGGAVMLDDGRRDDDVAVEIAEHPLGTGLGTINADDAEVFGPYLLDARMNDAARLLQDLLGTGPRRPRPFATSCRGHGHASKKRVRDNPILMDGSPGIFRFFSFLV